MPDLTPNLRPHMQLASDEYWGGASISAEHPSIASSHEWGMMHVITGAHKLLRKGVRQDTIVPGTQLPEMPSYDGLILRAPKGWNPQVLRVVEETRFVTTGSVVKEFILAPRYHRRPVDPITFDGMAKAMDNETLYTGRPARTLVDTGDRIVDVRRQVSYLRGAPDNPDILMGLRSDAVGKFMLGGAPSVITRDTLVGQVYEGPNWQWRIASAAVLSQP